MFVQNIFSPEEGLAVLSIISIHIVGKRKSLAVVIIIIYIIEI